MAGSFFDATPSYDGAPAPSPSACVDPFGWLLSLFSVPPPSYLPAAPSAGGGVTVTETKPEDPIARMCADPSAPIVFAPTGPVTIVLGADVRFAQE